MGFITKRRKHGKDAVFARIWLEMDSHFFTFAFFLSTFAL
jgi:hypothetical protein